MQDKDVERVLQNMSQDEVSLLERWFTSKLLGTIDKPPSSKESERNRENQLMEEAKETKSKKDPRRPPKSMKSGRVGENAEVC